jgi:hypothetical protein
MSEALYLVSRGNRVVEVRKEWSWPYGFEECAMVLEGESVQADHQRYISKCIRVDFRELPTLFAAILVAVAKGGEA